MYVCLSVCLCMPFFVRECVVGVCVCVCFCVWVCVGAFMPAPLGCRKGRMSALICPRRYLESVLVLVCVMVTLPRGDIVRWKPSSSGLVYSYPHKVFLGVLSERLLGRPGAQQLLEHVRTESEESPPSCPGAHLHCISTNVDMV